MSGALKALPFLVIIASSVIGMSAQAAPQAPGHVGCRAHPSRLDQVATRMVKAHYADDESVPNIAPIQTTWWLEAGLNVGVKYNVTYEAFIRPKEDAVFAIPVFPIFGVELDREEDAVYICAHSDTDPAKNHVTIYFLNGYGLEPKSSKRLIRNLVTPKRLKVAPRPLVLLGVSQTAKVVDKIFGWIPGFGELIFLPVRILTHARDLLGLTLDVFLGMGVERIVIKTDGIELATGVDLDDPAKARVSRFIPFLTEEELEAVDKTADETSTQAAFEIEP